MEAFSQGQARLMVRHISAADPHPVIGAGLTGVEEID